MIRSTIFEAKNSSSKLGKLIHKVLSLKGKGQTPAAKQVEERTKSRKLGVCLNQNFKLPQSFYDPLPESDSKLWSGEGK
jgi:hypothetical protein